jgi:hypothetical protein
MRRSPFLQALQRFHYLFATNVRNFYTRVLGLVAWLKIAVSLQRPPKFGTLIAVLGARLFKNDRTGMTAFSV